MSSPTALPRFMEALVAPAPGAGLVVETRPVPVPTEAQVLIQVAACAVCRTDLHLVDGELPGARYPVVPGHQVVGTVVAAGPASVLATGTPVGVAWLAWTCGRCDDCRTGRENLCDEARFHGCDRDGGFAEYMVADSRWCFPLDGTGLSLSAAAITPLLCGGLIGYRSLVLAGEARCLGLYGFGSAAHQLLQVARHQGREVLVFTRPGDAAAQDFARRLGASWAGGSDQLPPRPLDAALLFAPVGALVPAALAAVRKGGTVVCGGIHMSDIPAFPYRLLWGERVLRSVANLTRQDGRDFLPLAARAGLEPTVRTYPLNRGAEALRDLREGRILGTAVLVTAAARDRP